MTGFVHSISAKKKKNHTAFAFPVADGWVSVDCVERLVSEMIYIMCRVRERTLHIRSRCRRWYPFTDLKEYERQNWPKNHNDE